MIVKCFAIACVFSACAFGQGNLGGLTGRVTDSSGASVPDVSIQIRNIETGQES